MAMAIVTFEQRWNPHQEDWNFFNFNLNSIEFLGLSEKDVSQIYNECSDLRFRMEWKILDGEGNHEQVTMSAPLEVWEEYIFPINQKDT